MGELVERKISVRLFLLFRFNGENPAADGAEFIEVLLRRGGDIESHLVGHVLGCAKHARIKFA